MSDPPVNPYLAHLSADVASSRRRIRFNAQLKHRRPVHVQAQDTVEKTASDQPPTLPYPVDRRALHGNYAAYYGYRKHVSDCSVDARLQWLRSEWMAGKDILDIGCNSGMLTVQIAHTFDPHYILGIDLDPHLISKAERHLKRVYSLRQPVHRTKECESPHLDYFPQSLMDLYGYLPWFHPCRSLRATDKNITHNTDITIQQNTHQFPYNADFRHLNALSIDVSQFRQFNTILALSVTKWIHLNHNDDGLKLFFRKCFALLTEGGYFILEAQPWNSYTKSKIIKNFPNISTLAFRPDHFLNFLVDTIGFQLVANSITQNTTQSPITGFNRPIWVFQKPFITNIVDITLFNL